MDDLVAFPRARLDDDEAALRIMIEVGERHAAQATDAEIARLTPMFMALMTDPEMAALAARSAATGVPVPTDTNRLLAEIAFKRVILAEHEPEPWGKPHPELLRCSQGHGDEGYWTTWPCVEVRALIAVYSGHPDYEQFLSGAGTTPAGTSAP